MSKRHDRIYRHRAKQGPRPRDIDRANAHVSRKRTRAALRSLRYLRAPQLYLPDFTVGAVTGFGVLAAALVAVGVLS